MKGNSENIVIMMKEDRRLSNNNNSSVNNRFILAKDVRNNSGKVQLNKLNDFADHPFLNFLALSMILQDN